MRTIFKKHVAIICVVFMMFIASFFYAKVVDVQTSKLNGITIVLDAGHGGRDGGSVGKNGTIEKELNLEYVLMLKKKLVENGYTVVLTRKTDDGLYSPMASNKKQSDMNERLRIIKQANPNLVVSIHMNSFASTSAKGANTYYRKGDSASQICGDLIQKSLHSYCSAKSQTSKVGDYFMVNSSYYTSVLIECGFISNPEEEALLNTNEYKQKITDAIFNGILLYFGNKSI